MQLHRTLETKAVSAISKPQAVSRRVHVRAHGKFLIAGDEKFYVRGVTYGTFAPNEDGDQFPSRETVHRDFQLMAANRINAIRTYTSPPVWVLDAAEEHGLKVMVG